MFNLLMLGERAGSGFDAMRSGCAWAHHPEPHLEELFNPDKTKLALSMEVLTKDTPGAEPEVDWPHANATATHGPELQVINLVKDRGSITRLDVERLLGISRSSANNLLASMERKGLLTREGNARATRYHA